MFKNFAARIVSNTKKYDHVTLVSVKEPKVAPSKNQFILQGCCYGFQVYDGAWPQSI